MWNNTLSSYFWKFKLDINLWQSVIFIINDKEVSFKWNEIKFEKINDYFSDQSFYSQLNQSLEEFNKEIKENENVPLNFFLEKWLWLKIIKYEKEQEFVNQLLSEWFHFWNQENITNFILSSCENFNQSWEFWIIWKDEDEWSWCNISIDLWSTIQEVFDSKVNDEIDHDNDEFDWDFDDIYNIQDFIDWKINDVLKIFNWEKNNQNKVFDEENKKRFNTVLKNISWVLTFEKWWMKDIESIELLIWLKNSFDLNNFVIFNDENYQKISNSFLKQYISLWKEWVTKLKEDIWKHMNEIRELFLDIFIKEI